ncbi:methyltransferase family protein [Candidatus Marithrix sp. Canyon 246]|uniref:methyltransferase family protein n=1 Tax=Candidatus Marithrix sp. Canyon 246 TaxID=1827136 RepID=UPI00084A0101|nr:isoprenylcysteine carboxylmethyltransferase family protein [Candidatus Marithrix sp. Canyon 246]
MLKLIIPPPIYMLFFATIMWLLDKYMPIVQIFPETWQLLGLGLIAIAILLDLWSLTLFLLVRTTPNPIKPENASELVIRGMYRFSRNPMYLGLLTMLIGWAIYLGGLIAFFILPFFVITLNIQQIKPEEEVLEKKFGETYLAYKRCVRAWI